MVEEPVARAVHDTPRWYEMHRAVFCGGNRIALLRGGDALFPAMKAAIDAAQREIRLETYIFSDDPAALAIADRLIAAARRGVDVHVLVDGFGSKRTLPALQTHFDGTGVEFVVYRRVRGWLDAFRRGSWRRLHRKLMHVDRTVAFVGGINIIDDRHDVNHGWFEVPRLDFAVRVEGPLVAPIVQTLEAMRLRQRLRRGDFAALGPLDDDADPIESLRALIDRTRTSPRVTAAAYDDPSSMRAAFVVRDNFRQRRTIERAYVDAIVGARTRIAIINPYFYPARGLRHALERAAMRGVQVTLVMQGRPDYRFAAWAAQALYDELIRAGIRIVEYSPTFLHAKVAVVDGTWATVGSSNIDPLSLLANREANVVVRDAAFAADLAREIDAAIAVSTPVDRDHPATHGVGAWAVKTAVAFGARVFIALAGGARRY